MVMTLCKRIKNEKLQFTINRKAAKISALSSEEKDKYEYLTDEHVLHFDQDTINWQAKFTYSHLEKVFD